MTTTCMASRGGLEFGDSTAQYPTGERCSLNRCSNWQTACRDARLDAESSQANTDLIASARAPGVSVTHGRVRGVVVYQDRDRGLPIVSPKLLCGPRVNSATRPQDDMENLVVCRNSQQEEIRGSVVRINLHSVSFEVCGPSTLIRASEVLTQFQITFNDQPVYFGRAVVNSVIASGSTTVCDVSLENSWLIDGAGWQGRKDTPDRGYNRFLSDWQSEYAVREQFKLVVSDMHSFFCALRAWTDRVELGMKASQPGEHRKVEEDFLHTAAPRIGNSIDSIWSRFGPIAKDITEDLRPIYRMYLRRRLHPYLLCSPFAYRTYTKPLGYAGDYEMVNMIVRNPYEGESFFSKVINYWLLQQPPAEAHRNRLNHLAGILVEEVARVAHRGRIARILNLGCGPAIEVQRFIQNSPAADYASFTLLDFNDETIRFARRELENCRRIHRRRTQIECEKKSVQHVLKEAGRWTASNRPTYDLIYCAGLFDYIFDQVCLRLMSAFYSWLAPGGLVLATNVNAGKPYRYSLDFMLDWHLIDRDAGQLRRLAPHDSGVSATDLLADDTGSNLFLTVRKREDV